MHKIFFLAIFFSISMIVTAQDLNYDMEDIVVSASRIPVNLLLLNRDLVTINSEDIKNLSANSLQDILQFYGGLDIKQRGAASVQADLGIRGSTFEQTLLMLDGIKITDPQTGHHNMNLPIDLNMIERIEILKGQASKTFGANASGGVINIITKKSSQNEGKIKIFLSQFNSYEVGMSNSFRLGELSNAFSVNKQKSDGYRYNTNYDLSTFSINSNLITGTTESNFFVGYNKKNFGANGFYSNRFPDQREITETWLAYFKFTGLFSDITFSPKLYWRNNQDDFVLNRYNPSFYNNIHITDVIGLELESTFSNKFGITSLGGEYVIENIVSTNLGNHKRNRAGIFFEHNIDLKNNLSLNIGGFIYNYSSIGWKLWPGLDFGYSLTKQLRFFTSYGKAFRIPTFTELYYNDPNTIGNPNLKYEESDNYEFGGRYNTEVFYASFSYFIKNGENLIDWNRSSSESKWSVKNITKLNTNGYDLSLRIQLGKIVKSKVLGKINLNYSHINSDRETGELESRYLLDHLSDQLIISINSNFIFDINLNCYFSLEKRANYSDSFITDINLQKEIDNFELYLNINNIFNKYHEEFSGIPLQSRWFGGGLQYSIDF